MKRVVVAVALALASCSSSEGPVNSGVEGIALSGPQCPVQSAASPCPDRPVKIALRILRADGARDTTVTSGIDGRFRVPLEPGRYRIEHAEGAPSPPTVKTIEFEVEANRFTSVTVRVDTGLR